MLSPTNTSIREISRKLGLSEKMISKCKERFDSLTDGEWEEIFDDHAKERSDKTPELWKEHARQFWTQPYLANEHGEALQFRASVREIVRRDERPEGPVVN